MSSTRERDAEIRRTLSDLSGTRPLLCSAIRAHFKSLGVVVDEPLKVVPGTLVVSKAGDPGMLQVWGTNWFVEHSNQERHLGDTPEQAVEVLTERGYRITKHTLQSVLPCD